MKVLRIIARLNVGGPARHVTLVNAGLDARRHDTLLVFGTLDAGEASLESAAQEAGLRTIKLQSLGRRVSPFADLQALTEVTRLVFSEAPDVIHTHTAKAGTVGRLAACLFNITRRRSRRCLVVHTYHGHVFEGYFGTATSRAIRTVERCLALITHRIVTISPAQRHDIVERFRVAPVGRTTMIPLGLALEPLLALQPGAPDLRERLGLGTGEVVVGFLGRMVPIKDLPTLIHAFAMALERMPNMRLLLAGDGPERPRLSSSSSAWELTEEWCFSDGSTICRASTPRWIYVRSARSTKAHRSRSSKPWRRHGRSPPAQWAGSSMLSNRMSLDSWSRPAIRRHWRTRS